MRPKTHMKYYISDRKIKCLKRQLGTDIHLLSVYVTHWENVQGIEDHQALERAVAPSFSGFWRIRGFIADQTSSVSHPILEKKNRQHGPLGLSQATPQWFQTPAADWSHPAQSEPSARNSTTFETSSDFSLIQVPVWIRWDQGNNFDNPLNVMAKWLWYHLQTYSFSNCKFKSSTSAKI